MKPVIIILIIAIMCCSFSSSAGGAYFMLNSSPAPEPENESGDESGSGSGDESGSGSGDESGSGSGDESGSGSGDETPITGCTIEGADNYDPLATVGDMSDCTFPKRTFKLTGDCTNHEPFEVEVYPAQMEFTAEQIHRGLCAFPSSGGVGPQEYPDTIDEFINNNKHEHPRFYTFPGEESCDNMRNPGTIFAVYNSDAECSGGKRLVNLNRQVELPEYNANGNGYVMFRRN